MLRLLRRILKQCDPLGPTEIAGDRADFDAMITREILRYPCKYVLASRRDYKVEARLGK